MASGRTVDQLAAHVGGRVVGDGSKQISGIGDLRIAGDSQIAFVRSERYFEAAKGSSAGALLVPTEIDAETAQVIVDSPDVAFAKVAGLFHPVLTASVHAIHPQASVDESARIEEPVEIGACAVIEPGVSIGAGTVIHSGAIVRRGSKIGRDCVVHARVVLYPGTVLGDRVVVHGGAVIGADGFGYAKDGPTWVKVPQLGTVKLGDDVEIGPNVTVDRATLGVTSIGRGTKIDDLCHIGHNCQIGEDVVIVALTALSGSVKVGDRTMIGGHTVAGGHIEIPADTEIGGASVITRGPTEKGRYMGYPLMQLGDWGRVLAMLPRLPGLFRRVKKLENDASRD